GIQRAKYRGFIRGWQRALPHSRHYGTADLFVVRFRQLLIVGRTERVLAFPRSAAGTPGGKPLMATRDTIVIGASAGGVQALSTVVADLPADLPAAVFIVLHV